MKTILATITLLAVALLALPAIPATACPPTAFSLGAGYCSANVQAAYAAPVVASYAAPVYAPLQTYSYSAPSQALVLPGRVTYTQPQVTLQLSQATGYGYAQPLAVQSHSYGVQNFSAGYGGHSANFSAGYSAPVVLQSRNSHRAGQAFSASASAQFNAPQRQTGGNGGGDGVAAVGVGPLGRVRSVVDGNGNVQQFGVGGARRR